MRTSTRSDFSLLSCQTAVMSPITYEAAAAGYLAGVARAA